VQNPANHYIKEIKITGANGRLITTLKYKKQDNAKTQPFSYSFKKGEIKVLEPLKVTATCSRFGSKTSNPVEANFQTGP